MESLFQYSNHLISNMDTRFTRYLYQKMNWENRLIGIVGARGVGKTTLVLQYIKNELDTNKTLYVTAEDFYFGSNKLVDLADVFVKFGGKYLFIDDPLSSLDENHLIELAVNVAELIKLSPKELKFVITTHNPLFYNVIYNELNSKVGYMLDKNEDGTFELKEKKGDSNKSFSYHLFLKQTIEEAIEVDNIQKYHFTLLRNLYEKTANFLGYPRWSDLLPDDKQTYYNRIIQFTSHSTLSNEAVAEPTAAEKQTVKFLLDHLIENRYWKKEEQQ